MKEVGSIIIGTKVDNKGLKDGLKDTETIMKDFDNNHIVGEEAYKEFGEATKKELKEIEDLFDESKPKIKPEIDTEEAQTTAEFLYKDIEPVVQPKIEITDEEIELAKNKLQMRLEKAKLKITSTENQIASEKANIDAYEKEIDLLNQKNQAIYNEYEEWYKINALKEKGVELSQKQYDSYYSGLLVDIEARYKEANDEVLALIDKQEKSVNKVDELNQKLRIQKAEYSGINEELSEINNKNNIISNNFKNNIPTSSSIEKSIGRITKKVSMWGLAILGVRSAYMFIRQAMNTLSQYNETLANQINSIKLVLTSALEPVVNRILSLIITLMNYLNYLSVAWFGIDLFARASELSTKKTADNLGGAVGSAKALNKEMKQLAGFDEMNVLQDNSDKGGGGGAGGGGKIDTPEFDLPLVEIPEWLKWIADHGDLVRLILEGIATALLMIKGHLSLIQGLGIFLIIDGVVKLIKDLKTYLEDKTWANFAKVLEDVSEILLGLSLLVGITTPLGIILAVLSQIVAIISGIPGWIESIIRLIKEPSWDNFFRAVRSGIDSMGIVGKLIGWVFDKLGLLQPQIKLTEEAERDLKQAQEDLTSAQDTYVSSVDRAEEAQRRLNEVLNKYGVSSEQLDEIVKKGNENYAQLTDEQKEIYKAYLNNTNAQNNLKDATDKLTEAKKNEKIASLENSLAVAKEKGNYDKYKEAVMDAFNKGEISADDARELIGKAMSGMSDDSKQTFTKDIPDNIKKGLDKKEPEKDANKLKSGLLGIFGTMGNEVGTVLGGAIGGALKSIVNAIMWYIENKINTMVSNINSFIGLINKIPGVSIGKLSKVSLPRLAKGGIINRPGRGVPVGNAIAGERGAEGVIPLTDSQQMALLGEAIGKYITINANITNTMNGRVISRELQKINNESDFAFNR